MAARPPQAHGSAPDPTSARGRSSSFQGLLSALGPPFLFFVALPTVVYALNRDAVDIPKRAILESGLLAAAVVAASLWLLARLPRIGGSVAVACDVLTAALFVLILVPNRAGEITGFEDELARLGNRAPLLKLGFLIALGALWHRFRPRQLRTVARSIVETAAIGSALVALFLSSAADRSRHSAAGDARRLLALGSRSNVVVLVLDSFTGYRMVEILESEPEIRAALDGFTLYPRALASAHNTPAGSGAILTADLRDAIELEQGVVRNTRALESSFLAEAHRRGLDTAYLSPLTVEGSTIPSGDDVSLLPIERSSFAVRLRRYLEFLTVSSARVLPERAVRTVARLSSRARSSPTPDAETDAELLGRVTNPAVRKPLVSKLAFDRLVETLYVGSRERKLLFVFNALSHAPWNFTEDGRFEIDAGSKASSIFAARSIVRLVERLRELGVFDEALVIVASDHGGVPLEDATMGGVFPREHRLPLEFNPLLMVKPPRATHEVRVSEMTVWLGDIAATVRDVLDLPEPEGLPFASRSLLLPDDPDRRLELPLFFYRDHLSHHSALKDWVRVEARGTFRDFGAAAPLDPLFLLSRPAKIRLRSGIDERTMERIRMGLRHGRGTQYDAWIEVDGRQLLRAKTAGAVTLSDASGRLRARRFKRSAEGLAFLSANEPARNSLVAIVRIPRRLVSQRLHEVPPAESANELVNCLFVSSERSRPREVSRCSAGDVEVELEWR